MDSNVEPIVNGVRLLQAIANKNEDMDAAARALALFSSYFENKISVFAEIHASKLGYDDVVAFEAIQCAFNKVWMYPSFDMKKSRFKDPEKAIVAWLMGIVSSQMHQFSQKGECAQISPEEDLSVIENSEDFVNLHVSELDMETKMERVMALDNKLSTLDEKHRIIYLTYKAYQTRGKKLPRTLLEKLRKRLNITQTTIRVYKREACETLNDFELLQV